LCSLSSIPSNADYYPINHDAQRVETTLQQSSLSEPLHQADLAAVARVFHVTDAPAQVAFAALAGFPAAQGGAKLLKQKGTEACLT